MLALAATTACSDITLSPTHVIALEVNNTTPTVEQGDTVRLSARALNALGNPVPEAPITWAVLDTGTLVFQLDPSGLVHGMALGSGRVQASSDNLRSDPITVSVTPVPDTAAATIDETTRIATRWSSAFDHPCVKSSRDAGKSCPRGDLNSRSTPRQLKRPVGCEEQFRPAIPTEQSCTQRVQRRTRPGDDSAATVGLLPADVGICL